MYQRLRLCATLSALICAPAVAQAMDDNFDAAILDGKKWSTLQVLPDQIRFQTPGRCGAAAIEIFMRDGDGGLDCEDDCQRAEVRVAKTAWPVFGDEVWYAFSFRIDANTPSTGSARTVIGQWKAPGDDSPFLAQRFDNGVFHITVQDNDIRRVVARAEGDPDRMLVAQGLLSKLDRRDARTRTAVQTLQSLQLLKRDEPRVFRQYFARPLVDALESKTTVTPEAAQLADRLSLRDSALISTFDEMSFVADPEKYIGSSEIEITPEANRRLPDPRNGWVDMVYRIRGGRLDNQYGPIRKGEIEIWANGEKIVSVRGNIGAQLKLEKPLELIGPYFKFGVYRYKLPGGFSFQMDEFSQAPTRAALAKTCVVP